METLLPECCGVKTERVFLTPPLMGAMNFGREKAFTMPDGTFIDSGAQYKKYMKARGALSQSEGESEVAHVQKRKKKEYKKALRQAVVQSYKDLKAGNRKGLDAGVAPIKGTEIVYTNK
jgi:hypothetical protein